MPALSLPIHGIVYLQDVARVGLTTAQSAPADGFLTEHKRSGASVSTEIIGNNKRTVNGTMRAYVVSTKRKFSFQWELVPADYAHTIDGQLVATSNVIYGMGGNDMLNFYETYYNKAIYMYILNRTTTKTGGGAALTQANINTDLSNANTAGERYKVLINDFTYDVKKRNVKMGAGLTATDLWNVSMSFEEV
jgi:hypothetical protein